MKMKNDERTMFEIFFSKHEEEIQKKKLVKLEKDIWFWRREIFFERVRLKSGQKKKTKPKGEEKLKVFHREMKKENEKGDSKETQRSCKKGEKSFFL